MDHHFPDWEHRGDTKWLEIHGEEAMARFVADHPQHARETAISIFAREMFSDPKTGVMLSRAPKWWRRKCEQWLDEFRRHRAAAIPELKDAWKSHPWDNLDPSPPTRDDLDPSGPAPVVTVETRGQSR